MPIMYVLGRHKIAVADALGSRAMRADAAESITCGWLALVVVAVASLGIVWFLVREGREAWSGEDGCD
jgi:divalent metal cation (Fe/Co/Zn/Cd) transporter